jgi:hypothetical protein
VGLRRSRIYPAPDLFATIAALACAALSGAGHSGFLGVSGAHHVFVSVRR